MLKGYKTLLPLRTVDVVGVVECVFAMWLTGQRADGLGRGVRYYTSSDTTAHNLAYAVNIRTKRERLVYLVCSLLDLSFEYYFSLSFHFYCFFFISSCV